jgi:predicted dehydrogenase
MGKVFDIAMVGCGGVSPMHFQGYASHPERVRVVAACDPDAARAAAAGQQWNIPAIYHSLEEMIDGARWDVAVVCTPTPVRESVVRALASAGKHLFVEKPMADSLEEARRMVDTATKAGVRLAVDHNFRDHYPFDQARALIEAGRIGPVIGVTHQDLFFRQDRGWRVQHPRHALAVMGIHWLDGFRWMLESEARSLTCQTHRSRAIECIGETDAVVQMAFTSGASVSYTQSFSSPLALTKTLVLGESGLLVLDYDGIALHVKSAAKTPTERWPNPYAGTKKPESVFAGLERLLTAIETGQEPSNSGADNLRTVALLDGAYRSAAEHRLVRFENGVPA